jgi:predicted nuclease with TOPRIM domain
MGYFGANCRRNIPVVGREESLLCTSRNGLETQKGIANQEVLMTSAEEYKEAFDKANEEEKEKNREENEEYENELKEHLDNIRRRQIELFGKAPHLD